MFITQKVAEFAIYGNAFNSFRVALRFPGGVPVGITAKAYRGDEATEQTALRPAIIPTARFDTVILEVSAAQMAQVALIDFLYVEIAWGGLVRYRGPFRADRLPAEGQPDDIVILRNAMGNAMYVFAEELLAQMLDVQSDVNQKLAQIEALHEQTQDLRDEAEVFASQTESDRAATYADRQAVASDRNTVLDSTNLANQYKTSSFNSSVNAGEFADEAEGYKAQAEGFKNQAEGFKTQAEGFKNQTEGYKTQAEGFKNQAEGFKTQAEGFKNQAEGFKTQAEGFKNQAQTAATNYVVRPVSNVNTAYTIDLAVRDNQFHYLNLNGNITFTILNIADGRAAWVRLVQTGAGGFVPTFPASVKFPGGAAPDVNLTAGGVTVFILVANSDGTIDGVYSK